MGYCDIFEANVCIFILIIRNMKKKKVKMWSHRFIQQ